MKKKQLRAVMILFTLFTVYSCNLGTNDSNPTGYQLGQAIYLYCLAHWLKEERDWLKRVKNKQLIVAFGVLSIISGIGYAVTYHFAFNAYNCILVISGAACLFLYFTRLDFYNKFVNRMATAALGCYLLQDGVWGNQIYKWLQNFIGSGYHLFFEIMAFVGCFVSFWVVSYFLTIAANRIVKYVIKTIPKKVLDINFVN